MELKLDKPIVFLDLETTGTNIVKDRIVEISLLKIHPNGKQESKTMTINPTIPIDPKSTEIHGISDEDVKNAPTFAEVAKEVQQFIEGCDLAGFNSTRFDLPLLAEEFLRADIEYDLKRHRFIDVQVIFHKMEKRTLAAAYKFYCKKDLTNAHSAEADTQATYEILKAQLEHYDSLNNDMDELAEFSSHNKNVDHVGRIIYDEKGREVFNFGKYKGQSVEKVLSKDPAYYGWIMNNEFPLYTKKILTSIKLRMFKQ
ncbi:MAG: 3'-5' exonuclease [Bacteroidales bacterium]|nr:3'-5' exonuclease [Bacteroidales bacterium]